MGTVISVVQTWTPPFPRKLLTIQCSLPSKSRRPCSSNPGHFPYPVFGPTHRYAPEILPHEYLLPLSISPLPPCCRTRHRSGTVLLSPLTLTSLHLTTSHHPLNHPTPAKYICYSFCPGPMPCPFLPPFLALTCPCTWHSFPDSPNSAKCPPQSARLSPAPPAGRSCPDYSSQHWSFLGPPV